MNGLVTETNDQYHASDPISKSGLWTLYTRTPYHYRFTRGKHTPALDIGTATHTAILEPEKLDDTVIRGPSDRRGNKWKEAQDEANHKNAILLTEGDHDKVLAMRDVAACNSYLQALLRGDKLIEQSAYSEDPEHEVLIKCRPDLFNKTLGIIGDLKTAVSASSEDFSKAVGQRGYAMQEALYTDVFSRASGLSVDGFVFIVIEKPTDENPPIVKCYELDAAAVNEGYAQYRKALAMYAECHKIDTWPAYGDGIDTISLRRWDYRETQPGE